MNKMFDALAGGATPGIDALVGAFADIWPLLADLRATRQDPGWHAEGDVHIHTGMVLDELYASFEQASWPADVRRDLVLGALLHDIAKPLVTRDVEIRGRMRVAAPRHESLGRSWLAPRLAGLGLPYASVDRILGLVGSHHEPKLLVVRSSAPSAWLATALRVDPRLVAALEVADMRGRTCDDRAQQVEHIELFGLQADETADWIGQWAEDLRPRLAHLPPAAQDRAFGEAWLGATVDRWRSPEEAAFLAWQTPEQVPELVVLVGPSGSGKSTWSARHLLPRGFELLSLDILREELALDRDDQTSNGQVRQAARERLKDLLRHGRSVVWDATNLRKDVRDPLIDIGRRYGALVTLVAFHRSPEQLARGNRARRWEVPQGVLDRQIDMMDWPEATEAHRVVVVDAAGEVAWMTGSLQARPW